MYAKQFSCGCCNALFSGMCGIYCLIYGVFCPMQFYFSLVLKVWKSASFLPAIALMALLIPGVTYAANSGGVANKPIENDYTGSLDGVNWTPVNGNVFIDSDATNVYGGYSDVIGYMVMGNRVTVAGGPNATVWGGQAIDGTAIGNSVFIIDADILFGVYGGGALKGDAIANSVTVTGGNILHVTGGYSEAGAAIGNIVHISGGNIQGVVTGGSAVNAVAIGNTVTIVGTPRFSTSGTDTTKFFGGKATAGYDAYTGNTLNIFTHGLSVETVGNFQHYNFALFNGMEPGLALTGMDAPSLGGATSTFRASVVLAGSTFRKGDTVTLMKKTTSGIFTDLPTFLPGQARQGISLVYDYTLGVDDPATPTSILATITNVQSAPEGKAPLEGRAAALGIANLGGELAAGAGMQSAHSAATGLASGNAGGLGIAPFMAFSGSSQRYNSGSHTDVKGLAFLAGLAKTWEAPAADILAGAFFEGAWGNYVSHNSFHSIGAVKGKGNTRTLGGGILARVDVTNAALRGLYAEASFRVGNLSTDYKSNNLQDAMGNIAHYAISTAYYGAHAGLGYKWELSEKARLDVYAKYFWTHQNGKNVHILGDAFNFKASNSHRTHLGARFDYAINENITPYIGAAWEYEFDGKARATTYGFNVPAPSVKGSTGIGEIGLSWKPASASGFSMDIGVQGFAGKRQGIAGNFVIKYTF